VRDWVTATLTKAAATKKVFMVRRISSLVDEIESYAS